MVCFYFMGPARAFSAIGDEAWSESQLAVLSDAISVSHVMRPPCFCIFAETYFPFPSLLPAMIFMNALLLTTMANLALAGHRSRLT